MVMSYITKVGAEREGFLSDEHGEAIDTSSAPQMMNGSTFHQLGVMGSDAGVGHFESASVPCDSLQSAVYKLSVLEAGLQKQHQKAIMYRQTKRPAWMTGSGVWVHKPRYVALRRAAVLEAGSGAEAVIDQMTDYAAVHLNVSGKWNPIGPEGWFLYNVMNNAAPYIAATIHRDIDDGYGHLGIWNGFAFPERFPQYRHWFSTLAQFQQFFESVPRMMRELRKEQWVEHPKHADGKPIMQEFGNENDLGVCWHFCRTKRSSRGEWYMELRFLPSMDDRPLLRYGGMVLESIEILLDWYYTNFHNRPVLTLQDAQYAYECVAKQVPIFPSAPVDQGQWEELLAR